MDHDQQLIVKNSFFPNVDVKEAQESELGQSKEDENGADNDEHIQGCSIGHLNHIVILVMIRLPRYT